MNSSIYIPEKIKVGFCKREDTYTKKLGYVIYFDAKGTLRKEKSWQSWRDKKIAPEDFTNEPTSGFVLNKKVGGYCYHWDARQTYTRVYDPRGFEFEITVPNLLYILENADCLKGKGLSGEFVYGWDGTELLLIPTSAPEYTEIANYSKLMATNIKSKDLIPGGTYLSNKNEKWVYLGRFESYEEVRYYYSSSDTGKPKGKKYFYQSLEYKDTIETRSAPSVIKCISDTPVDNYAELMEELQHSTIFSPTDPSKDEYVPLTKAEVRRQPYTTAFFTYKGREWETSWWASSINKGGANLNFSLKGRSSYGLYGSHYTQYRNEADELGKMSEGITTSEGMVELGKKLGFTVRRRYLKNGKIAKIK